MAFAHLVDAAALLFATWLLLCLYDIVQMKRDPGRCEMTYMWPNYVRVDVPEGVGPYTLYRYVESRQHYVYKLKMEAHELPASKDAWPVLFLPGSGGHSRQVRSLASECARRELQLGKRMYDWYALHFNEEKSALDGRLLFRELKHALATVRELSGMYPQHGENGSKLIVVGHSMGGVVAQAMLNELNKEQGPWIHALITLASPHAGPPLPWQPAVNRFYAKLDPAVTKESLSRTFFLALAGGYRDALIHEKLVQLGNEQMATTVALSVERMEGIALSPDHRSILWCNQLVKAITKVLEDLQPNMTSDAFDPVLFASAIDMKFSRSKGAANQQREFPQQWEKTYILLQKNYGRIPAVFASYLLVRELASLSCVQETSQWASYQVKPNFMNYFVVGCSLVGSAIEPGIPLLLALAFSAWKFWHTDRKDRCRFRFLYLDIVCSLTMLPATIAWVEWPTLSPNAGDMLLGFLLAEHILQVSAGNVGLNAVHTKRGWLLLLIFSTAYSSYAFWANESYRILHVGAIYAFIHMFLSMQGPPMPQQNIKQQ
mmetsp:Transcript_4333/g.27591  ORF Transcript_4333/g.27591 Transcript_4333/m.27591 type:complete len:545 (+) Transcript_4333:1461-3095(+)